MAEGRLSRWSRLKSKGGADAREEAQVEADKVLTDTAKAEPPDEFATLPGGRRARGFVPAMAPLAPDPEDDDDRFTRGVGHAESDDAVGEPAGEDVARDAATVIEQEDLFAGIDEEEMSDDEREIVASLPPLESLDKDSDFSPFLRDGVPEFLKRRALRLLWRLNPFFNFRDGLNDYDEDFNVVHKIIDEMTGAYKVGRGHLSEQELRDMTPESTRRAFGELDDDAGAVGDADAEIDVAPESEPVAEEGPAEEPEKPDESDADKGENSENRENNIKTHKNDTREKGDES